MKKTLVAMAAAASFASAVVAAPSQADAACWGCYVGAGVAAGAIAGAGAAYPYGAYYGYGPAYYYAPAPVY